MKIYFLHCIELNYNDFILSTSDFKLINKRLKRKQKDFPSHTYEIRTLFL
jgi:hypothetical protein